MDHKLVSIIMAGGLGKRMSQTKAKVLHEIRGFPMIYYVIQNAILVGSDRIFIVVGKYKNQIKDAVSNLFSDDILQKIVYVIQPEVILDGKLCSLGTGDAVRACINAFDEYNYSKNTNVVILSGDVPFIDKDDLLNFSKCTNSIMVANVENPDGYGRIFLNENDDLSYIVEHSLCDDDQLQCCKVNAGIYNLSLRTLKETIPNIEINEKKKEFLLTDFYLFTENPIHVFNTRIVPKNVNTLTELESL